jgi:hypothetical protein
MVETKGPAEHSPLGEGIEQHGPDAPPHMAETVFPLAQGYESKTLITAPTEQQDRSSKDNGEYRYAVRHGFPPFTSVRAVL